MVSFFSFSHFQNDFLLKYGKLRGLGVGEYLCIFFPLSSPLFTLVARISCRKLSFKKAIGEREKQRKNMGAERSGIEIYKKLREN